MKKLRLLLLLLPLMPSLIFAQPKSQPQSASSPQKFRAFIGGFFGKSYDVKLVNSSLLAYEVREAANVIQRREVKVTAAQWQTFFQQLDKANVWSWQAEYDDKNTMDGTSWYFEIETANQSLKTRGRNKYPNEQAFATFKQGVRDLLGGEEFQ